MSTGPAGDGRSVGWTDTGDSRGLSPVVGVVLLIGIVVLGTVLVTLVGGAALDDSRSSVEVSRAEGAMAELDARASDTALGLDETSARDVAFGPTGRDGRLYTTHESWIRVSIVNASTGVADATVVNESLGTVTYANGETTVAYEGGGVWRADGGNATILSPPEFHFRNTTLTLPIVSVDGDAALTEEFRVQRAESPVRKYPNTSAGLVNRVSDSKVDITVHSTYYLAWGQYFEDTTDGIVTYDHGRETVTVRFLSVPKWVGLGDGIVATSGQGEVKIPGNSVYIDSYNSSTGTGRYTDTQGANGSIVVVNDVWVTGTADILGNVRSGRVATLSGNTNVSGAVYWTAGYDPKGAQVSGGDEQIEGVAAFEPIDAYVLSTVAEVKASNNNSDVPEISGNQLTGTATLNTGRYYLERIDVGPGHTLDIDTNGGDVVIAVEDTITVEGNGGNAAAIQVTGGGTVTLFVVGDEAVDLEVGKNGRIDVPDERSGQFRVYGTKEFDAVITSNTGNTLRFEGVIYAPAGSSGTGSVTIGQADFYGAIVTGSLEIKQGANIHYDLGLGREKFPRAPSVSRLEYMHVAVHPIEITSR
jgi:hypothetical protein